MKIYIIGSTGSGKTTLAKYLSKKLNIKYYELDCIVFDDLDNHRRRTNEEIDILFNNIINTDNWIIEDVGRDIFKSGREKCDKIYFIKLSKFEVIKRVIKRWIKQRRGLEEYNFPPTIKSLFYMFSYTRSFYKNEKKLLNSMKIYKKIEYIDKNKLNELEDLC